MVEQAQQVVPHEATLDGHAEADAIDVLQDRWGEVEARAQAAERLGRSSGQDRAITALLGALHDPSPRVRGQAAFALGRLGALRAVGPLVSALNDPSDDVRCRVAVALGLIGSSSVLEATSDADEETEATVRWSAIRALGELGPAGVDCLVKALKHGPRSERARVAVALGETRDVSAVEPLSELLGDEDPLVRVRAREALEKIRESRVF